MTQAKAEISEEASRKRAAPSSDFDTTKRVKLERGQAQSTAKSTPEPATPQIAHPAQQIITGPLTYAQLYTLATDPAMTSFDGQQLPIELVLQIVLGSIMSADQRRLEAAIAVRPLTIFSSQMLTRCHIGRARSLHGADGEPCAAVRHTFTSGYTARIKHTLGHRRRATGRAANVWRGRR